MVLLILLLWLLRWCASSWPSQRPTGLWLEIAFKRHRATFRYTLVAAEEKHLRSDLMWKVGGQSRIKGEDFEVSRIQEESFDSSSIQRDNKTSFMTKEFRTYPYTGRHLRTLSMTSFLVSRHLYREKHGRIYTGRPPNPSVSIRAKRVSLSELIER